MYIFWILHQTTTCSSTSCSAYSCISFESYIKPQPWWLVVGSGGVVYLLNPTSNHNLTWWYTEWTEVVYLLNPTSNHNFVNVPLLQVTVVYLLNPTSNHNLQLKGEHHCKLYIFWILHQTTTLLSSSPHPARCISFESYIKPQLLVCISIFVYVVYLLNPTSNHNL